MDYVLSKLPYIFPPNPGLFHDVKTQELQLDIISASLPTENSTVIHRHSLTQSVPADFSPYIPFTRGFFSSCVFVFGLCAFGRSILSFIICTVGRKYTPPFPPHPLLPHSPPVVFSVLQQWLSSIRTQHLL